VLTRSQFDWVRTYARERAGINLTEAKYDLVYSRLVRRIRALGLDAFSPYFDRLASGDETEARELINALTTNVTAFFREAHHFTFLAENARKPPGRPFRVWSCACSTGEEPYSVAITLRECNVAHQLLASDLDTAVLRTAARGVYGRDKVAMLSRARLERWFYEGRGRRSGSVRVKPELGRHLEFRQINLIDAWSIRGPLDAIFCRNVIIYFDRPTQDELMRRFADALRPGGHLFLGHSESVRGSPRFELVGRTTYQRIAK